MGRRGIRIGAVAVATGVVAAIALTLPGSALGISTSCSSQEGTGSMLVQGSPGERNLFTIASKPPQGNLVGMVGRGTNASGDPVEFDTVCGNEVSRFQTVAVELGDGNDKLLTNKSIASIDPGFGDPPVTGFKPLFKGIELLASGGAGKDKLVGHKGDSVLGGGTGKDKIKDTGGNDLIKPGPGKDKIKAKDGKPDLIVCDRKDEVKADPEDTLRGC